MVSEQVVQAILWGYGSGLGFVLLLLLTASRGGEK